MTESTSPDPNAASLDDLVRDVRRRYPAVVVWLALDTNGYLVISKMVVPEPERNTGIGTDIMTRLTAAADAIHVPMTLTPSIDFGGSLVRLRMFYRSFGFVPNRGRTRDYATRETMIRPASPPR
ncbi:MAG: GNAT family N-acetyltransferase [Mycobacteriaceae bacterium]|nr:GNAT family N-acetyltransferase [Mycobacteriaceae bacterium]